MLDEWRKCCCGVCGKTGPRKHVQCPWSMKWSYKVVEMRLGGGRFFMPCRAMKSLAFRSSRALEKVLWAHLLCKLGCKELESEGEKSLRTLGIWHTSNKKQTRAVDWPERTVPRHSLSLVMRPRKSGKGETLGNFQMPYLEQPGCMWWLHSSCGIVTLEGGTGWISLGLSGKYPFLDVSRIGILHRHQAELEIQSCWSVF